MGLFSGIKKAVKKVFKGVKKVFKKVGKFVGKVLSSDWGKALLTAAAVFTGGMALAAGAGGFLGSSSATFLGKFVAGAKGFLGGLLNPVGAGKGFFAGMQGGGGLAGAAQGAAQGQGIFNIAGVSDAGSLAGVATDPGQMVAEGGGKVATAPGAEAAAAPNAATAGVAPPPAMGPPVSLAPAGIPGSTAAAQPGMLKRLAGGAMDFAKSTGGGLLLTNMAQGYAQGAMMEDQLKYGDFYDRQWNDPRQQMLLDTASRQRPRIPQGYLDRARQFDAETSSRRFPQSAGGPDRGYATATGGT